MKKTILLDSRKGGGLTLVMVLGLATGIANADYVFGTPEKLGPTINTSDNDLTPYIAPDELSLYFSSDRPEGYGSFDIWMSTRATKEDPWSEAVNPGPPINTPDTDWSPCLSPDGCTLYFGSWRVGGMGMDDLWVSTRPTINGPWGEPSNLGPNINTSENDGSPSISSDGLELYFISAFRSGGHGGSDIWMATRETQDSEWGPAVNLGSPVNTECEDSFPMLSADGLLLFFCSGLVGSARPGTMGFFSDIWMARRPSRDAAWGEPVNLGEPVNSVEDESFPHLSTDGRTLYYTVGGSPWGGPRGDLYQVSIDPIVDLNSDGIVNALDICIIVDHWGEDDALCDIGPTPFGDGIIDIEDLKVLAEYLFEDYRLIHHWMLDETGGDIAHDSVGDKNAVIYGDPLWQPLAGRIDGALALDGEDDYLRTPFILNPASRTFCVFAWIKGGAPGQTIISQKDVGGDQGNTWLMADASYGRLMTRLMHPPFSPLISQSVITDNQWHHVGLMYDFIALHRYLYVDGIEVAKDGDFVGGKGSEGGLIMGADKTLNAASFFSGLIDDVRIYNNVLTEEEIAALAQ